MCTGIDLDCCAILTAQMKQYRLIQIFFSCTNDDVLFLVIFSLRYLNLGWTQLTDQCVHYLCRSIPTTIEQLTLTGFRQGMTDECRNEYQSLNEYLLFALLKVWKISHVELFVFAY